MANLLKMNQKRKRKLLNLKEKLEILDKMDKNVPVSVLAKEYGVGTSTIYEYKQSKKKLRKFATEIARLSNTPEKNGKTEKPQKKRSWKYEKMMKEVNAWCRQQRATGLPPGRIKIKKIALRFAEIFEVTNFTANSVWLDKFMKRHGIPNRQVTDDVGASVEPLHEVLEMGNTAKASTRPASTPDEGSAQASSSTNRTYLSLEQKYEAIKLVESGVTRADVRREFGIGKTTLRTFMKKRKKIKQLYLSRFKRKTLQPKKSSIPGEVHSEKSDQSHNDETPVLNGENDLRIQDEITVCHRLIAGDPVTQISLDYGVSEATIRHIKKKFGKVLSPSSASENYRTIAEVLKPKEKNSHNIEEKSKTTKKPKAGETAAQATQDSDEGEVTIQDVKKKFMKPEYVSLRDKLSSTMKGLKVENILMAIQQLEKGVSASLVGRDLGLTKEIVQNVKSFMETESISVSSGAVEGCKKKAIKLEKLSADEQQHTDSTSSPVGGGTKVDVGAITGVKKKTFKSKKSFLSLEVKMDILNRFDKGEGPTAIGRALGLHESTVRNVRKSKHKILKVMRSQLQSKNSSSSCVVKTEKRLVAWIRKQRQLKARVTSPMIQMMAKRIHEKILLEEGSSPEKFTPDSAWLESFKKRYFVKKVAQQENQLSSEPVGGGWVLETQNKAVEPTVMTERSGTDYHPSVTQRAASPHRGSTMVLSTVAREVRELFLSRSQPTNPYKCNAMSPRVILIRLSPKLIEKYTMLEIVKSEPLSDDETWMTSYSHDVDATSDWEGSEWDMNILEPVVEISDQPTSSPKKKRKRQSLGFGRKKARHTGNQEGIKDTQFMGHEQSEYADIPIKQEPTEPVENIPPNVPMAVLPAGNTYAPSLPMFQVPTTSLTVFMPQPQSVMMPHAVDYSLAPSNNVLMNQQSERSNTISPNISESENAIHSEVQLEQNIKQETPDTDTDNVFVMPFGGELQPEQNSSNQTGQESDVVVCDTVNRNEELETARRNRAAAIAESMELSADGSSYKQLRDLTFKLVELNNKNLVCDDRIQKLREEYERKVAVIEAEKRGNETQIDKVLSAIQEWKEARKRSQTD